MMAILQKLCIVWAPSLTIYPPQGRQLLQGKQKLDYDPIPQLSYFIPENEAGSNIVR